MVIQRWQSVLLLCSCVLMACFSFASLGQIQTTDYSFNLTTLGISFEGESTQYAPNQMEVSTWYFFAVSLLSSLIPLITIFCYKNLPLQKKLCMVEVLLIVAVSGITAIIGYNVIEGGTIGWSTVICCPILALISTIMAYNRINKDYQLLLSVDRLR